MSTSFEKFYRRIMNRLFPPRRRGERPFYTEWEWERKRRREQIQPLLLEPADSKDTLYGDLFSQQLKDLLEGLSFSPRDQEILLLRLEGYTLREIARRVGMSHRGVGKILLRCYQKLGPSLSEAEARLEPERSGHYGWQEVYLQSLRRRMRHR